MSHRLDPLLRPQSIAVVGATVKEGRVGSHTITNLLAGHYPGRLLAVNPGYTDVLGVPCYPTIHDVPEAVEHVIFAVSDERIEAALDDVISAGVKAVTIMSTLVLGDDTEPPLMERIRNKADGAGLLVCGGNGMGFYNFAERIWACGFDTRPHRHGGNVALISHSGSGMSGILNVDERIDFNFAVSTGQELTVAMDEYLDFALELPGTRVVGLFMETARNPEGLIAAFEKARKKGIPIVAIKIGRTEFAAELTVSHCGAMAGTDSAFDAVFDRYGVQRVNDMDELATTLIMMAQPYPVADGGLVTLHDSGGERQLIIDLADAAGVSLTQLLPETIAKLEQILEPGLPAVNPLDAWSVGGPDSHRIMQDSLAALMTDPGAAFGAVIQDRAPRSAIYPEYCDYLRSGHAASGKPAFLVASRQGTGSDPATVDVTREGFPVLDGVTSFLTGARCMLAYRDFTRRPETVPPAVPSGLAGQWRNRLDSATINNGDLIDDYQAHSLLDAFEIPVNPVRFVSTVAEAVDAARELGFPVTLKIAEPGVTHKTEVAGVHLALVADDEVEAAYESLSKYHGRRASVSPMIEGGVEMILGVVQDAHFGPLIALGSGGIHAEAMNDVVFALPPFDRETARRHVDKLRLRSMLDGQRGKSPVDVNAFCDAAARVSVLAHELKDRIREIDLNPVIVREKGCVAVDWVVVASDRRTSETRQREAV